jgi:ferredoxin
VLECDFYICGPLQFIDLSDATLTGLAVEPDRILIERFDSLPLPEPAGDAEPGPDAVPSTHTTETDTDTTETVTLILNGKKHPIAYRSGDTVLETARRGGLQPPFSCEAGDCATCMALLREGSVRMRANNALTPEEVDEGWVLTCQSVPQSRTVTVEYEPL